MVLIPWKFPLSERTFFGTCSTTSEMTAAPCKVVARREKKLVLFDDTANLLRHASRSVAQKNALDWGPSAGQSESWKISRLRYARNCAIVRIKS